MPPVNLILSPKSSWNSLLDEQSVLTLRRLRNLLRNRKFRYGLSEDILNPYLESISPPVESLVVVCQQRSCAE